MDPGGAAARGGCDACNCLMVPAAHGVVVFILWSAPTPGLSLLAVCMGMLVVAIDVNN